MVKKMIFAMLMCALTLCSGVIAFANSENAVVLRFEMGSTIFTSDGEARQMDVAPFIDPVYNRAMLPLRVIAEELGATVNWIESTRTITIERGDDSITLSVDTPLPGGMGMAMIVNERAMVPIRYIAETLNVPVEWDEASSASIITVPPSIPPMTSLPVTFATPIQRTPTIVPTPMQTPTITPSPTGQTHVVTPPPTRRRSATQPTIWQTPVPPAIETPSPTPPVTEIPAPTPPEVELPVPTPPEIGSPVPTPPQIAPPTLIFTREDFLATQSSIILPDGGVLLSEEETEAWIAEYRQMGGASAFEREVIRLINEERVARGLNAIVYDEAHMMSARFEAQKIVSGSSATLRGQMFGTGHVLRDNIERPHSPQSFLFSLTNSASLSRIFFEREEPAHARIGFGTQVDGNEVVLNIALAR